MIARPTLGSYVHLAAWSGGYVLTGLLSAAWFSHGDPSPLVWLPNGVASAAGLLLGWRALPGLAIGGAVLGGLQPANDLAGPLLPCITASLVALLAPRVLRGRNVLGDAFNLLSFLVIAVIACLVGGALLAEPVLQSVSALLAGHVLLAPWLVASLRPHNRRDLRASFSLESGAALLCTVLLGWLIRSNITPLFSVLPGLTMLPALLWSVFRLAPPAATSVQLLAGILLTTAQLMAATAAGNDSPALLMQPLRLVFGTVLMTQLVLAITQERRRMQGHLQRQALRLRRLVRLRTAELAEANRRLQALSESDGLTGVANRRHFDAALEREWRRALRRGEPLTLGLIDVDHFKAYNDHYGHLQGDEVLQRVAEALGAMASRAEDLVARYGGEEFAVILPGLDRHEASVMAQRLREAVLALAIPHARGGDEQVITVSGGLVALVPDSTGHPRELLTAADQLLYAAKAKGRNRVLVQAASVADEVSAEAS